MADNFPTVHPHSAGIDIGAEWVYVFVPGHAVQAFSTFTESFEQLVQYLQSAGVKTVALEATGIYWFSLYELLEQGGIEVFLVNGAHVKNVPGRKTDVRDCQWLQQLHQAGLLRPSFVPEESIRQVRTYVRLRDDHLSLRAGHIQHLQKALTSMNIRLHQVISQLNGTSGLAIIRAILQGQRDPEQLANLCAEQIQRHKRAEVIASLRGLYKPEHLFALQHALDGYDFYTRQIAACDAQLQILLQTLADQLPPLPPSDTPRKGKMPRHNAPNIDGLHLRLLTLTQGVDLATISGLTDLSFLKLIAEIGTDLSRWPTVKHFTAWLGLAPSAHQSGKMKKRRRTRPKTQAGQIFREAAQSLARSKHIALGVFYRRIAAKRGPKVANMATARKLAERVYWLFTKGLQFVEKGVQAYENQLKMRQEKMLHKLASTLGYTLAPTTVH